MIEINSLPTVLWPISCFDRRRKNPFPVYNRWLWLDWSILSADQVSEVLSLLKQRERHQSPPFNLNEQIVTISIKPCDQNARMLRFRNLFAEVPNNDIESFMLYGNRRDRCLRTVHVDAEYFEDETGVPISKFDMIQHVSGINTPIIVGDPESILRLGPGSPTNTEKWDRKKANTIAHFLDVIERICASKWFQSPPSITSRLRDHNNEELLEATFPTDEQLNSVLAYFRQLHAKDKLLGNSATAYIGHCTDARKAWWINERTQSFQNLIDSSPGFYSTNDITRRKIIRMFMYGAGLLHSDSKYGDDEALNAFVAKHGQHKAVMIFHSCLYDFLRIAVDIYRVIQQDFDYWINDCGLVGPSRFQIRKLFESHIKPND